MTTQVRALVIATLLALPAASFAQAVDIPAVVTLDFPEKTWTFASFTQQFEADLNDAAGDVSRSGLMAALGHRFELSEDTYFATQFSYIGSYYDFSSGAGRGGGGAAYRWKDTHAASVFGLFGWKASESWTIVAGGLFKLAGETGADVGDSVTGGGLLGFDYQASDTLTVGVLLGVMSQIEDDTAILPVPTVDWRFADKWRLQFGLLGSLGHPGLGPELSFKPSDAFELGLGLAFQKRRFRLDDHVNNSARGPNPNLDGVGEETGVPLYVRLRWAPQKTLFFDVFGGVTTGGRVRVENQNGNRINESGYDAAPILGVRGQLLF